METTTTRPNPQTEAMTNHKGGSGLLILERTSFAVGVTKRDIKHNLPSDKKAHCRNAIPQNFTVALEASLLGQSYSHGNYNYPPI